MNTHDLLVIFTIIACIIIMTAFGFAWRYINSTTSKDLPERKKWISQLPSVISTLGVLGTFLGITIGLIHFDTKDLDSSIPLLLDGLKTAFFTSLLGMAGSLILNRVVSHKFDTEANTSEIEKAANLIVDTLNANQKNLPTVLNNSCRELAITLSKDETTKNILHDVEQLKDDVEELKGHAGDLNEVMKSILSHLSIIQDNSVSTSEQIKDDVEELKGHSGDIKEGILSIQSLLNSVNDNTSSTADELPRLRAVAVTATASISAIDNNIEDLNDNLSKIEDSISEINENIISNQNTDEEDY